MFEKLARDVRLPMRRDILRRIERVEQRAGISDTPPPIVILKFANPGDECHRALVNDREYHREPYETEEQFERRVFADMRERNEQPRGLFFFAGE
jgi:hypothetical protein